MEEEKNEKVLTKKELKLKAQEMKLLEKQRKMEEKAAIKEEKERRKNSFGRKVRNFILTIIFVIVLLLVGFYFGQKYLENKEKDLYDEKMDQIYQNALKAEQDKEYKKSIELLKSIDESYSKYSDVKEKLKETSQLYLNDYLTEADNYLKNEKFEKALKVLDNIEDEYKNEEIVLEKKSDIIIASIKYEVAELEKKKDTLKIIEYLAEYDTTISDEVEDVVDEFLKKYKDDFILEARELIKTDIEKAKLKIESASKILPDDKDIEQLKEELKEAEKKVEEELEKEKEQEKEKGKEKDTKSEDNKKDTNSKAESKDTKNKLFDL